MKKLNSHQNSLQHHLSSYLFLMFLLFSSMCFGKQKEEQYFVTCGGTRIDLTKIMSINNDSVIFNGNNNLSFLLIDSIASYEHNAPGKVGKGIAIGAGVGILLGALIGYSVAPREDDSLLAPIGQLIFTGGGALIGLPSGALIGAAIGNSSKMNVNIDLRKYNKTEKKNLLWAIAGF